MAASGGIDWPTTVKPILTTIYGPFFEKNDIVEVIQAIVKSEHEFQTHEDNYDLFYTCFACLSAHFITVNSSTLTADQLNSAADAIRIILRQLLKKLSDQAVYQYDESNTTPTNVSIKQLLLPIVGLCGIEGGTLQPSDQVILTSLLKSAKLPTLHASENVSKTNSQAHQISSSSTPEKQSSNITRRSDALLEQLTLSSRPSNYNHNLQLGSKEVADQGLGQSIDIKKWLQNTCAALLMELRAGGVILKVCSSLPCLQRYLARWNLAKENLQSPQLLNADPSMLHFLVNEVSICQVALALPCLEPFTPERIRILSDISMSWLLCANAMALIHSKDEESEQQTIALVEGALSLFNNVGETLKNSTRAGGYVYQNHLMLGGWLLVCGLHSVLANETGSKGSRVRSTGRLPSGMGVVWVALGSACVKVCRSLLHDSRLETLAVSDADGNINDVQPARLHALDHYSAYQRALRLLANNNIHQLLIRLGVTCYRKATSLKQQLDTAQEQHNSSTYCKDMLLMSEDDDSEDDSEPLLGLWFELTLVAPENNKNTLQARTNSEMADEGNEEPNVSSLVPDKSDPSSYITLATEVFDLLSEEILSEGSDKLGVQVIELEEAHATLLGALVKDLDLETARTDTGTIPPSFGARLGTLYSSFSSSLMRYLRVLIGMPMFVEMKTVFINRLRSAQSTNYRHNFIPLQMGCRTASLVAGVTLSAEASEREAIVMAHWQKLLNTLAECALQEYPQPDHDLDDLNVEHAQLVVYLFHSLTLMEKKTILLMTANSIIKVSESLNLTEGNVAPHQLMLSTRLMLLLEYLMRHLYEAPPTLLHQIEWNLLNAPGLAQSSSQPSPPGSKTITDAGLPKSRIYCEVPLIEQAYRFLVQDDKSMRPKFYALTFAEINNQEMPKLDGLACNFVLGTPHKLKYPLLLDALISFLNCLSVCDVVGNPSPALRAVVHYTFQTAWRLVVCMPPSTPHVDQLSAGTDATLPPPLTLHATIWAPRADSKKIFNVWLKDVLGKQGMYTQYAENLLNRVTENCDNMDYAAWLASETIKNLKRNDEPALLDIVSCDAAIVRLHMCLTDAVPAPAADARLAKQFVPDFLDLIEIVFRCCRNAADLELREDLANDDLSDDLVAAMRLEIYGVKSSTDLSPPQLGFWLRGCLPNDAANTLIKIGDTPGGVARDLTKYSNDVIPSESAVLAVIAAHCETLTQSKDYTIGPSLRMLAYSAAKLLEIGSTKMVDDPDQTARALELLIPAIADGRLKFISEPCTNAIKILVPVQQKSEQLIIEHVLRTTYPALVDHLQPSTEKILRCVVKYWEKILLKPAGRAAFESVFSENSHYVLGEILLAASRGKSSYCERVFRLFNKIFIGCDNSELSDKLCISICKFIGISDQEKLSDLLSLLCTASASLSQSSSIDHHSRSVSEVDPPTPTAPAPEPSQSSSVEECVTKSEPTDTQPNGKTPPEKSDNLNSPSVENNSSLLSNLTKHIVLHDLAVARTRVLAGVIRACGGRAPAPALLREMCRLADAHDGSGHSILFPAVVQWMQYCVESLSSLDTLEMLEETDAPKPPQLESASVLLAYLTDALYAITPTQNWRSASPSLEAPSDINMDIDCDEGPDDDDTSADDSDEEAALQNRLCTFTVTSREFMNQHWYHCHTCKMVDGVGVCTVCARVCHRGHDVSYAKFGNFFCDCGAKPDNSCKALVKRASSASAVGGVMTNQREEGPAPSIRRRASSPAPPAAPPAVRTPVMATNLQNCSFLSTFSGWGVCLAGIERLLEALAEPVRTACEAGAAVGAHTRAQRALAQLHLGEKHFSHTDTLMVPTLGSQEGAFENVRMSYTGEHGQTIRQLISGHKVRRVAMCCLASPHGRRQHLAVSHEKGKITVLQLSALLKQADTSKHKLTLTRLSSAPIPFTVITLSGNPTNEDLLAVCGLKECHVLLFNSAGAISEHFVLNTVLENSDYIIKAVWLPGSQTQLALVTSNFIKIFDLSKDLNNPLHHFLLPSGKVRDVTFVYQDGIMNLLCISSVGHIYYQPTNEESRATHGPFYVTNTLEVLHPEIQDVAGIIGSGGISIYYSHTLKMLFFSYAQGKSFLAPLATVEESIKGTAMITMSSSSTAVKEGSGRSKSAAQSLCNWAEVAGHPGLVTAVTHTTNSPVVLMLTPTQIFVQEIKVVPTKAKITDMVAVRHACGGSGDYKTTLILLCEDGSLRMYAASSQNTHYWLAPSLQPRHKRRPTPAHNFRPAKQAAPKPAANGEPQFPIDFFEHCVPLPDIEVGGSDLLQVYNTAQIKHRLNTTGLYVASTSEFTMEITNPDMFKVITGVRILLGTQDVARAPTFVEIGGRTIPTLVGSRSRWFDIPLTREETLQFYNKLSIKIGASQDPEGVIMVDSLKIYGKDKDHFGWPEDNDDGPCPSSSKVLQENDSNAMPCGVERVACGALEALELGAAGGAGGAVVGSAGAGAAAARRLLTAPASHALHQRAAALMRALYQNSYHQQKDQAILSYVTDELASMVAANDARNIDPEAFVRVVMLARSVAVARPQYLVKYSPPTPPKPADGDWSSLWRGEGSAVGQWRHVGALAAGAAWKLASVRSAGGVAAGGLRHRDHALHALIDVLHAYATHADHNMVDFVNHVYLSFLLAEEQTISFGAKAAIVRVLRPRVKRRRVYIPSPPNTPGASTSGAAESGTGTTTGGGTEEGSQFVDVDDSLEPMVLLAPDAGLEGLLDIPPDADDETMVELAIALSLQEQPRAAPAPRVYTASAPGSDDEGSTAATDGSTLRTSPAEAAGSAGSESGGSGAESIGGVSGRSSAYGEMVSAPSAGVIAATNATSASSATAGAEWGETESRRLHALRLSLLSAALNQLPALHQLPGHRAIPLMQVVLMIGGELDTSVEQEKALLDKLLDTLLAEIDMTGDEPHVRTPARELQLILMRLLSVLMARWKTASGGKAESAAAGVSRAVAAALVKAGAPAYCLTVLTALLPYWKEKHADTTPPAPGQQLLKPQPPHPLPDMTPLFIKEYVKSHALDVFDNYPQLLMEMALRLPCQIHKHCDPLQFDNRWKTLLCEYMMYPHTPLRKQVRKLLLLLCGSRERYRQLRDIHAIDTHLAAAKKLLESDLQYDDQVKLMEHFKACAESVTARTGNWQQACGTDRPSTLPWLVKVAPTLHPAVAPTLLSLLHAALAPNTKQTPSGSSNNTASASITNTGQAAPAAVTATTAVVHSTTATEWADREKSADSDAYISDSSKFQEARVPHLVHLIQKEVSQEEISRFIRVFLLETNTTSVRWQAHALLLAIYNNSSHAEQVKLVELLWNIWPSLPQYGKRAGQFVDLIGYFTIKTSDIESERYLRMAVDLLKSQNVRLETHGNASLYIALANYVELDGYYLESEPCLVCNNPELPMTTIKLQTIKIDSKFTTTTQIVKLVNSHMISRISLRIGDIKRSKMVRTINFYYNNKSVQAVQELRNKPGMWQKAKKIVLQSGQTEVKVDFPLPIVACNLMMEYADFYENQQASAESLQCPRCSASVPATPGVCANCGENVYQCHKCRAINYDEKDPFLCHACGFCKYAKFEYTVMARPCCAVDSIENDDDRKKMVTNIGTLLDKADRVYKQLTNLKPSLETLVHKITDQRIERMEDTGTGTQINRSIQSLAHKYCVDCKGHFDDLSKIIQKVLACRKELVAYDRSQSEQHKSETPAYTGTLCNDSEYGGGGCYGCSASSAEYCVTLLRALASQKPMRKSLCDLGLLHELVQFNLTRPTTQCQESVRCLICLITKNNLLATEDACNLVSRRIMVSLLGAAAAGDPRATLRPLVALLGALVTMQDSIPCWEIRIRSIVRLWVWCSPQLTKIAGIPPFAATILKADTNFDNLPGIGSALSPNAQQYALQQVVIPCLRFMLFMLYPEQPSVTTLLSANPDVETRDKEWVDGTIEWWWSGGLAVELGSWLSGKVSVPHWSRLAKPAKTTAEIPGEGNLRDTHLASKYVAKWRQKVLLSHGMQPLKLEENSWIKAVMFDPGSRLARETACEMLRALCDSYERTKAVLLLLISFLPEVGRAGEASEQFLQFFQSLASEVPWKQFLALRGVLQLLADLMTKEIEQLHRLEKTTLTSDLSQGYALKRLTELLALLLEEAGARRVYKTKLVGAVLGGYLSLRGLVVQRTRLTDNTQEKLLELLEEMTTGTEAETAEFMAVCIETVRKYPLHDFRTPVFIFERLCSIIYPEENDVGEFFLTLEKDPQQEDFLQGRMLGNPYSSTEPGLGPLMRDVKNKICMDCELVALLEDDNGMELLVCNKIMSLDLPVKDVYKKVWLSGGESGDTMRVVYRMRGLLGDATEEFVETLNATSQEAVDDEQTYRMANVLADCGGLEVMIQRLAAIQRVMAARALAGTLLRLLGLCVRVRRCVRVLTRHDTRALPVLLHALNLAAEDERDLPRPQLTCQLLEIMERILSVAASESLESFLQFSLTFGGPEYVQALLNCTEIPGIRNNSVALGHLTRVLAALVYGNDLKMALLCEHFKPVFDFDKLDSEQLADEEFRMELFCVLCANIERNAIGGTLKDYLISLGIVRDALQYITKHAPCVKPTLVVTDSDELKEFISRPALKYILRFLTGLATDHEPTQMAVCEKVIPIVHRLEQVSSGEHVGSLAENLLEALRSHKKCEQIVQDARDYTRQEKKRLAMAVRERKLGALGMKSNERGQVTADCSLTQQLADLAEETGAVCCICREGYKYQPTKVLGVYTFTKRCCVEEYEIRSRKTLGYTTVSHYNVVHVECHMAAVRQARARDEWESAALQNASTRCNGLLPLWGPHVPESAFAGCMARHTTYLQECTGHRDITYTCTIHDVKLLLLRFARGKTFHDDTGGGGPLSNMQLVPALLHMTLYVMNTSRVTSRETTNLNGCMEWNPAKVLESAHDAEGPLYFAVLMLLLYPHAKWREYRLEWIRRAILLGHARAIIPVGNSGPALRALTQEQKELKEWTCYKPYLIFISIIDQLYSVMFKNVTANTIEQWPVKLAEYIRNNDEANAKTSDKIVTLLTDEFLPCASFEEFCDVAGLLEEIPEPHVFIANILEQQP